MHADFVQRLSAQSTLGEMPTWGESLDLEVRGEVLAALLRAQPELPGVVVTEDGVVRGAISRGQYLQLVGRHLGLELYHPRPIRGMYDALAEARADVPPLVLPASTTIQDAVRRALERPPAMLYEPLIVAQDAASSTDAGSLRLVDFKNLLRADSRVSALRNLQMGQILATVQEGFLLVDPDHRIASEYSRSVEQIFATPSIAGRSFDELLGTLLPAERAQLGREYLDTLFDPNVIESLVVQINPLRQVVATLPDGQMRHLAFRFRRSVEGRTIRRVLVRVEDVTREVEMAAELEAQKQRAQRRVQVVFDLVGGDAAEAGGYLRRLDGTFAAGLALLGDGPDAAQVVRPEDVDRLFRQIHGLKGEAGLLGLRTYQDELHRFEDRLDALRTGQVTAPRIAATRAGLASLRGLVEETLSVVEQLQQLGRQLGPGETSHPEERSDASPLFDSIARLVDEMSDRHGTPARFVTHQDEDLVPGAYRQMLREVLVQLARNSLVHGLEPPEERHRLGKPTVGTLQLAVRHHTDTRQLELIFQDDGAGLDLDALRRRARELGVAIEDVRPEHLVFASGLSTSDEVGLDAGRGVGMDLVRAHIEEHGGVVIPHTERGRFTAFQIVLPLLDAEPSTDQATDRATSTTTAPTTTAVEMHG